MRVHIRQRPTTNGYRLPRYNPRSFMTRTGTRLCAHLALAFFFCLPAVAQWTEPTAQLAREIAAITGPGTVTLTVHNASSITADNIPVIKRDLQNELRSAGVRVVAMNAAAEIRLTLSENAQSYVWIAEVRQANETRVAMVAAPRSLDAAPALSGPLVSIRKTLMWSQEDAILDVAQVQAAEPHMIVLDASAVSLYKMTIGRWTLEQQFAIAHARTWPRDLRGRLVLARDHLFDAYLPGVLCESSRQAPLRVNCHAGDTWPIGGSQMALFHASRNFFTGALTPAIGKVTSPFYSAAAIPRPQYTLWVFARTDGFVHLVDGVNDVGIRVRDWGSDVAAVKSACGAQIQLLVTGIADGDTADVVRAFEIADREPVEVARPLEFEGPITSLWTAADGNSATAVVRNLKTGKYDVFELGITCGQ